VEPVVEPDRTVLPLVFVTVGTDHHPFDRLIAWVDSWLEDGGSGRARCLVQSGTSRIPRVAPWRQYLPSLEVQAMMQEASCIVCHGGPSTIIDSARHGVKPIVVPRLKTLGEHVDDHQVAFVRWIALQQEILLATTEERFRTLLDAGVSHPESLRTSPPEVEPGTAIELLERWIDELVGRPRGRRAP
jgi:UDP-N-acetylglucosamine transferase subunit ALG13